MKNFEWRNDVKIVSLETFKVPQSLFLKITTDNGLVGWGEPVVEGHADTAEGAVREMAEYLVGKNALNIEDIWQVFYRSGSYRGGPILTSAISGIEQALWDIKGKWLGVPVHELLGGAVRDKMRVYAWLYQENIEGLREEAKARVAAGYTAVKMCATIKTEWIDGFQKVNEAVERVAAVREVVGYDVGVGIDFHGRIHRGMAKVVARELEPFKPLFFEEPVLPENNEALAELAKLTSVPIATGERMYTRWDFKSILSQGGVDIIQPDLSHAGGIWEVRKISAMAEAYDMAVAPHCPLGPIAFASCLQLDFCTPNAWIQEQGLNVHDAKSKALACLVDPRVFGFEKGFVRRPTAPGLGIEVNEEKVREMTKEGYKVHPPLWRAEDGTVIEW
jgi:galactonate dehydratase